MALVSGLVDPMAEVHTLGFGQGFVCPVTTPSTSLPVFGFPVLLHSVGKSWMAASSIEKCLEG